MQISPATATLSLTAIGTPASGRANRVECGVDRVRLGERRVPPDHAEGADPCVDGVDVGEVGADDVDRRHLPGSHQCGDLDRRQPDDLGNAMRPRDSSASVHAWTVTSAPDTF